MKTENYFKEFGIQLEPIHLIFSGDLYKDIFEKKNNKTVAETLEHRRYAKLASNTSKNYPGSLHEPLGQFLAHLKQNGDPFYKSFLNRHGDEVYSKFQIDDPLYLDQTGIYAFFLGDELKYIGRCRDSMRKRINQGYGKIHPKNCYLDGQATNCHLNAKITASRKEISLWMYTMPTSSGIEDTEKSLIHAFEPQWNIQRG